MSKSKNTLPLCRLLQQQGFGSRKDCTRLIRAGLVELGGQIIEDPHWVTPFEDGFEFTVAGIKRTVAKTLYIALHKPAGYECTSQSQHHESVFALFPPQMIARGLQSAGRLDVDTEGLLLLSDDGAFVHHVTSPRREIPKRYEVRLKHPVGPEFAQILLDGVELRAEKATFAALSCTLIEADLLDMVIGEGKFHQVKRMVAAAGNRVEGLRRLAVGPIELQDLPVGQWRILSAQEVSTLGYGVGQ